MEMNEKLRTLTERLGTLKTSITTEEATKTSMIMPFFQLLGYDIFNPLEFVPEYTADVGTKKKEKVDYAIIIDDAPLIFVECKSCHENLNKHSSQLIRYFNTTPEARFAILTNGIVYKFFTDLENANLMDKTPFLTVDLLDLKERDVAELKKFRKEALDIDNILSSAENLKFTRLVKEWFAQELDSPSTNFVKMAINDIHDGVKSQKVIDQFTPIVKRATQQYINDSINSKIQSALNREEPVVTQLEVSDPDPEGKKIVTTLEELEAFGAIKAILHDTVSGDRIAYRDTGSYFGILLDDNNRKWICRAHLDGAKKFITVSDLDKNPVRYDISSIDDIYKYSNEIIEACKKYL